MRHRNVALAGFAVLLGGCVSNSREPNAIVREFEAYGISRVVLRASAVENARVRHVVMDAPYITVTGIPSGGAGGYHSPDPHWRETRAARWGLDFVARRFGRVLVVSTKGDTGYIHHMYT